MRELHASIELPAYLQYPVQTETVQAAYLPVLHGSTVSFRGRVSRELNHAEVTIDEVTKPMAASDAIINFPARSMRWVAHRNLPSLGATNTISTGRPRGS